MGSEALDFDKDQIIEEITEKDQEYTRMAIDEIKKQFDEIEEKPEECKGKLCANMIAKEFDGMPLIDEAKINQVLDVLVRKNILEREIPEGTGIPHYSLNKK